MVSFECAKCLTPGDRVMLFDFISPGRIVKLCKRCAEEEDFPVIESPSELELKETEKKPSVYDRLTKISGYEKPEPSPEKTLKEKEREIQDNQLKELVDKSLQAVIPAKAVPTDHLVNNFHWVIMRVRRSKKLTQKELAQALRESEVAIKMIEQGTLSSKTPMLIDKIENYLGINLKKDDTGFLDKRVEIRSEQEPRTEPSISFDPMATKRLTIADLKEMRQKREEEVLMKKPEEEKEAEIEKDIEEKETGEKPLTDEEIDDILYGRV